MKPFCCITAVVFLWVTAFSSPSLAEPSGATTQPCDRFYFDRCPECHRLFGTRGDPVEKWFGARQVRFCHAECLAHFESDLMDGFRRLDAQQIRDQLPLYPLKTSIVSGAELPETPVDFIFNNRLIRVASDAERRAFESRADQYWAELDRATLSYQAARYWITKCPEQGATLDLPGDLQFTVVVAQRIIRVCCDDCHQRVREHPSQYLPLIDSALRNPPAYLTVTTRPTRPAGS